MATAAPPAVISYTLDRHNAIIDVNEGWEAFASQNEGEGLSLEDIRGHLIWEYVASAEVRYIWNEVLERVRRRGRSTTIPFRCDGPATRREIEAYISALPNGCIQYENYLHREDARTPIPLLSMQTAGGTNGCVRMCSWCKNILAPAGWLELEDAVNELRLLDQQAMPRISHGVCPDCFERIMSSI